MGFWSLVRRVASKVIWVRGPPNTVRLSVMTCAPGSFRPRLREGFDADVGRDGSLTVAGGERGHRIGVAKRHGQMVEAMWIAP